MAESSMPDPATGQVPAAGHQPYVPDDAVLKEFTWPAVLVGTALGIIFGASSLYLVLKVGMTISASIPVAVLSITLFRVFSKAFAVRRATILENNIVQTTGSAGESIAFGVGVTMPALMLLGFEMEITRVMLVSVLGGILGILMMIPLRRAFIVKQHGTLKYPEGTACADVLIVGEQGGSSAKTVFLGFGIAFVYQFLWQGMKLWKEIPDRTLAWFKGATPSLEVNPALLGVGYIIGTKISCIMVAGGVLASFVLIPAIHFFGDGLSEALYPATMPIRQMSEDDLWRAYVLYIGTGAVAAGGIVSLFRAMPLIIGSIKAGLADVRWSPDAANGKRRAGRTDRDLPIRLVGASAMVLILVIWLTLPLGTFFSWVNLVGAILIVLFGFLFVTVSSRLTGEIGSSSNPISGMTVATLLLTCLIFLTLNWTEPQHRLVALSVAAIVCIASSNGGTTSQDLKTGFLVGATPKYQQWAILVGAVSSALVIGSILIVLNNASTVYTTRNLPPLKTPIDVARLADRAYAPNDDTEYYVWRAREGEMAGVPQGKYLVDARGRIRYLVDPGINGSKSRRDDGTEVQKFKAPQARLMALITDGILNQKLPWALVLLGVFIAAVLELCGVPSLPFAVGVYLPLSSSTPIFVGGLVRYVVEKSGGNGAAQSETESEMTPGVLLSTGYIAGGAIAGVLLAFLSFSDAPAQYLRIWQYRSQTVTESKPLGTLYRDAALDDLGLAGQSLTKTEEEEVAKRAAGIEELNADQLARYVKVSKGMALALPKHEEYRAAQDTTLGEIAEETQGRAAMAQTLFDLNEDRLKLPASLPAGATLKLPQRTWPALAAFGLLAAVLTLVGLGSSKESESKEQGADGSSR